MESEESEQLGDRKMKKAEREMGRQGVKLERDHGLVIRELGLVLSRSEIESPMIQVKKMLHPYLRKHSNM